MQVEENPDFREFAAIWNEVWPARPVDPALMEFDAATLEPQYQDRRWLIQEVGVVSLSRNLGAFHPGRWILEVAVRPDFRNCGYGSALFEVARNAVADPTRFDSRVVEGDAASLAYAERRGFREAKREFFSSLDLASATIMLIGPGHESIVPFAEIQRADFEREMHELFELVRVDVPRLDPPTRLTFEFYREQVLGDPQFRPDLTMVAVDGPDLVGFSTVYEAIEPGWLDQGFTGVRRDYRGRGVARRLKQAVIVAGRRAGFTFMRTNNDSLNAPMLAINDRLGFRREIATLTVVHDVTPR